MAIEQPVTQPEARRKDPKKTRAWRVTQQPERDARAAECHGNGSSVHTSAIQVRWRNSAVRVTISRSRFGGSAICTRYVDDRTEAERSCAARH
jgi:hypothetical protein